MPNGTYGGVRGRKTKEIGGKLRKSFVFLLLDLHLCSKKTIKTKMDVTEKQNYESPQCLVLHLQAEGVIAASTEGIRPGYGDWITNEWEG